MKNNSEIIRDFCLAWSRLDPDELSAFFTEDGCYHNMPMAAVRGRDQIREFIRQFVANWQESDWQIINILESGDTVVAERLDKTRTNAGSVDLPCTGVFEMEKGRIKVWRDYFDLNTYMRAMKSE